MVLFLVGFRFFNILFWLVLNLVLGLFFKLKLQTKEYIKNICMYAENR